MAGWLPSPRQGRVRGFRAFWSYTDRYSVAGKRQCCCAGSRLYAHETIYDKVVAGVADIASKIKVGPGLDPATEMGPLVSEEQFDRVTSFIADGRNAGA